MPPIITVENLSQCHVIDEFRWAILGQQSRIYLPGFLLSMGLVAVLFVLGLWYFRRTEREFADVI